MAFKEWAVVVDALETGVQRLILRKGGLSEGRGGFQPEHGRFFLFPTRFHQQRDQVIPAAQQRYDEIVADFPSQDQVRISSWAEVTSWQKLENLAEVKRLQGQHVWREEVIAGRFEWGRDQAIFALELQVFRLPCPWVGLMLPAYGGCKSWVELEEDIATDGSTPVFPSRSESRIPGSSARV